MGLLRGGFLVTRLSEKCAGYVSFVYVDEGRNEFLTLGGAGWLSEAEVHAAFDALPTAADTQDNIVADLLDEDGVTILRDKEVARATAEAMLGESFEALYSRAVEKRAS